MVVALLALAAGAARAQSQAANGTIEGTIKDASGGLLPGVTVTVHNTDTGGRARRRDRRQRAVPRAAAAARRLPGDGGAERLQEVAADGHPLTAGSSAVINMSLEVGGVSEVVSVQADAAVVDLGKIDVGRNLNEREIHNLPLVSRNPYNFALLQPGVSGLENSEFGVPRFSANGSLLRINYQMDGNTNTQKDRAGLRLMPMSEVAIGEVKVTTSGYAPEFGQTMGLVYNAITPSGTNKLRGDVSYRFRRTPFSAYPFFSTITPRSAENKPADVVNTVTASSGGAIVHDKMHYYAGFERTYRDMTNTFNLTPELVASVGQPPQPDTVPAYQSVRFFLGKIDYQVAQGHRLTTRVELVREQQPVQRRRWRHVHDRARVRLQGRDELDRRPVRVELGIEPAERAAHAVRPAAFPSAVARRPRRDLGDDHQRDLLRSSDVGRRGFRAGHHPDPRQLHADQGASQLQAGLRLPVSQRLARRAADGGLHVSRRSRRTRRPRRARPPSATRRSRRSSATRTSRWRASCSARSGRTTGA